MIASLPTHNCAYTIWKFLEERFPDYSLKTLDEILHKSIALSKMNSSDPSFGNCLFELTNLKHAKGDVGIISDIISEAIRIHKGEHFDDHLSNELPSLGVDQSQDDVEHGYYAEDDDSDYDLDDAMRHFGLMANLRGYMAGGKEWVLDSDVPITWPEIKICFVSLLKTTALESMSLLVITQRVRWLALVRWPSHMIAPYKMLCSLNLLATVYFSYLG